MTDIVIKRAPDYTGDKAWRVLFAGREIRIVAPNRTEALVTAAAAWGIRWQDAAYPYRADTKRSEAVRYVTEALLVNPYIQSCRVYDVTFDGSTLHMRVEYTTPYGRDAIYV